MNRNCRDDHDVIGSKTKRRVIMKDADFRADAEIRRPEADAEKRAVRRLVGDRLRLERNHL